MLTLANNGGSQDTAKSKAVEWNQECNYTAWKKFLYWHVFWRKRVFFPLKIVLTDYFSFTKSFFFYKDVFLFRKRKRSQKPSAFLSLHLHSLQFEIKKINIWNLITPPEILWISSLNLLLCASSTWTCTVKCHYAHSCICETSCHAHLKVWNKSAVDTSETMLRPLIFLEVARFSKICTKCCLVTQIQPMFVWFYLNLKPCINCRRSNFTASMKIS